MHLEITGKIHVNQVGYRPDDKKIAIICGGEGRFELVDEKSGEVVFKGETTELVRDGLSGDRVSYADFSSVKKQGRYYLTLSGIGKSYSFDIAKEVYRDVKNAMLKALYYQRCGIQLDEKFAGDWKHKSCHMQEGFVYPSKARKLDGCGGWHDAGDYGKYTVPGAVAVAHLLLAYEFFPEAFREEINIPESGNGMPDILNECKYELDWLFKMQDHSGGTYHKLTTCKFPGFIMPEEDLADLHFTPVSSTATGDFAAVMAMAARVYKNYDAEYANRCVTAAVKAWEWLQQNMELTGTKNPEGIETGEYVDLNDSDERFWAASELYRTTGETKYREYVNNAYKSGDKNFFSLGWENVAGLGVIAYLFGNESKADGALYTAMKTDFIEYADEFLGRVGTDGYEISLLENDYLWGSNMIVMMNAMHLIIAHLLVGEEKYITAAQGHLHYLLGRNTLDYCYVTGFGSKKVMHPHHRPSAADGVKEPVPGMVAGGPDKHLHDDIARAQLKGLAPAKCFIDHVDSYSTNEITIYWNSPAVFVAAYFDR